MRTTSSFWWHIVVYGAFMKTRISYCTLFLACLLIIPRTAIGHGIRRKISACFLRKWFNRITQVRFHHFLGNIVSFFVSVLMPIAVLGIISLEARPLYAAGALAITEIMGKNSNILLDEDGDSSDWIEIHNGTQKKINLEGYGLSDKAGDLPKWVFPARVIEPDEYLIVFASGKDRAVIDGELHANFKLSERDQGVYLFYGKNRGISSMGIEKFSKDISCGRNAASGRIEYFPQPTPGKANTTPAFSPVVRYSLKEGFYPS
ncbi:MAG: hypothetical protein GF384_08810, partial [Elusimicrobia bacterium]|nr:hypothetical protein [Elusimicrobiota bacterium]